MADLAELKRLLAAATPGPWQTVKDHPTISTVAYVRAPSRHPWDEIASVYQCDYPDNDANAALIAAAFNALPGLIAAAEERDRLRECLEAAPEPAHYSRSATHERAGDPCDEDYAYWYYGARKEALE